MARMLKVGLASAGTAIAVAAAFFLHPRNGARRRAKVAAAVRRESANVATLVGTAVDTGSRRHPRHHDDAALAGRVRLALEMGIGAGAEQLTVSTERGLVRVRGEVEDIVDIARYEALVRTVAGVRDVDNLLRVRVTNGAHPRAVLA